MLSGFFIDRPIFAWVIALFIAVLGAAAINKLPVAQYPTVAPPAIVINAAYPAAFVSKAEIRQWPLFGWLAAKNDTVFLRRGSRGHAKIVNGEIAALLELGRHVALFPEGTTTDGSHVQNFHAALLQPAIDAGAPIQPLALAYRLPDGRYTRAAAYDGGLSLGESIAAIIAEQQIVARVRVAPALQTDETPNRKTLAHAARDAIVERIDAL